MASTVKQPGHTMTRGSITISTAVLGKNVADMIYMKLRGFKQFRIATYLGMKISRILRLQIILGFPRGGIADDGARVGIYNSYPTNGGRGGDNGFRTALLVLP